MLFLWVSVRATLGVLWAQRKTSTGMCECVSTCCVSLPSSKRLMPLRPCEAITIKSAFCFLAVAMMASDTTSDFTVTDLTLTPLAFAALATVSRLAWAASVHCFSMRLTSATDKGMLPSK